MVKWRDNIYYTKMETKLEVWCAKVKPTPVLYY